MRKGGKSFFFDTVTLSNFALAGRLDLFSVRYGTRLHVTPEVLDELTDGVVAGLPILAAVEELLIEEAFSSAEPLSIPDDRDTYRQLLYVLSPGEASCVVCAKSRGGVAVTDDRAARRCCSECGVKFTGTVGILKACCEDGALAAEEADSVLQSMIDAGYRSPVKRVSDLMERNDLR